MPPLQGSHRTTRDAFGSDSKSGEVSDETFTPSATPSIPSRFDSIDVSVDADATESEKVQLFSFHLPRFSCAAQIFHFLNVSSDEIRVSEVPTLLGLFKRMHDECLELTKALQEAKAENTRLKSPASAKSSSGHAPPPTMSLI